MKLFIIFAAGLALACCSRTQPAPEIIHRATPWDPFLDTLQARTIDWFLDVTPISTGLTPDRRPTPSASSIAAVGFALSTYPVAIERGMIARAEGARRALTTLRFLWSIPQGAQTQGAGGYHGIFYHFIDTLSGVRAWNCELSTIDTGLLMAGALFCGSYFNNQSDDERAIRAYADSLYRRVDWTWAMAGMKGIAMGWLPDEGFHREYWHGYNEAMILYILALGSPTHPVPASVWDAWTGTYLWAAHEGETLVNFMPLFGHQYSHCWIDFRDIRDEYMRGKGIDYFENSRRATLVHHAYGKENPGHWNDYSDSVWGWTACDGPKDTAFAVGGIRRLFRSYSARGTGADERVDDGTIAPTAAAASVPFESELCTRALKAMKEKYGARLWTRYGFRDAFNPTYITPETPDGWFDVDYLGIDQGPIVLMIENYRTGLIWNTMRTNPFIIQGLAKAGFTGGWLPNTRTTN
jgi:hypothetical protein